MKHMNAKRKIGIVLMIVAVALPLGLFFFQEKGVMFTIRSHELIERKLTPREINAMNEVTILKKRISDLNQDELSALNTWVPPGTPLPENIKSNADLQRTVEAYEKKLAENIKAAYGENHFEKEAWQIDFSKETKIPYRQIIGIGVLIFFAGLGIFIFSFFSPKRVS